MESFEGHAVHISDEEDDNVQMIPLSPEWTNAINIEIPSVEPNESETMRWDRAISRSPTAICTIGVIAYCLWIFVVEMVYILFWRFGTNGGHLDAIIFEITQEEVDYMTIMYGIMIIISIIFLCLIFGLNLPGRWYQKPMYFCCMLLTFFWLSFATAFIIAEIFEQETDTHLTIGTVVGLFMLFTICGPICIFIFCIAICG